MCRLKNNPAKRSEDLLSWLSLSLASDPMRVILLKLELKTAALYFSISDRFSDEFESYSL
jgi:hypothetical protein